MAGEITITPNITLRNSRLRHQYSPGKIVIDQSTARVYSQVYTIGTSEESITSWGDIETPGVMQLLNLDATNYVEWGPATGSYIGHLTANDGSSTTGLPWAIWYGHSTTDLYLKADTAACDVLVTVYDR